MVITGLTRNQLGSNPPRVRISPSPPSKGNEKDIAQETPDFIGGFAVSTVEIFTSDFADVKKVFSLSVVSRTLAQPNTSHRAHG